MAWKDREGKKMIGNFVSGLARKIDKIKYDMFGKEIKLTLSNITDTYHYLESVKVQENMPFDQFKSWWRGNWRSDKSQILTPAVFIYLIEVALFEQSKKVFLKVM